MTALPYFAKMDAKIKATWEVIAIKQMGHHWNGYFLLVYHLKLNKVRDMGPMSIPLVQAPALTSNVCYSNYATKLSRILYLHAN